MMMQAYPSIRLSVLIIFAALCLNCSDLYAKKEHVVKRFAAKRYDGKKIVVRQVKPPRNVGGILPPEHMVAKAAERFYKALDVLPENFVKRSRMRYVTFYINPTLDGKGVGGLAYQDRIILNVNFSSGTVYHELFHVFDKQRVQAKWKKLNNKKFVYTGSEYYPAELSRKKRNRKDENLSSGRFDQDFVSRYAMSNELEDRAETFAHMICEKERFLLRTAKSPVLKKKMEYIIDMTDKRNLLGKTFWWEIFKKDVSAK